MKGLIFNKGNMRFAYALPADGRVGSSSRGQDKEIVCYWLSLGIVLI